MKISELLENVHKIGYHVSMSKNTEAIVKYGIKPSKVNNKVYIWTDLNMAEWFRDLHQDDGKDMTLWKIDLSDVKLETDPETLNMHDWSSRFRDGQFGHGYMTSDKIGPNRILGEV